MQKMREREEEKWRKVNESVKSGKADGREPGKVQKSIEEKRN